MLFKSDTPTTHRLWFVLAATFTFKALLDLRHGIASDFVWPAAFWLITVYLWLLRRKWRLAGADGIDTHYTAFDRALHRYQTKYDQAPLTTKGIYWAFMVVAAIAIYLVFSR